MDHMDHKLNDKYNNSILLISYNEKKNKFGKSYTDDLFSKIENEKPLFIFIATQESISGSDLHYQHALKVFLLKNNYDLIDKKENTSYNKYIII